MVHNRRKLKLLSINFLSTLGLSSICVYSPSTYLVRLVICLQPKVRYKLLFKRQLLHCTFARIAKTCKYDTLNVCRPNKSLIILHL